MRGVYKITFLYLEQCGPKYIANAHFLCCILIKGKQNPLPPPPQFLHFYVFYFRQGQPNSTILFKGIEYPPFFQLSHFFQENLFNNAMQIICLTRLIVWFCSRFEKQGYSCKMTTPGILTVQCIDRLENI